MKRVFLWTSFSLIIGILLSYYFNLKPILVFILFLLMFIYTFYNIMRERFNNVQIIIIFLLIGIFLEMFMDNSSLLSHIDKSKDYSGTVEDIVGDKENKKKYIIKINKIDNKKIKGERILLTIIGEDDLDIGWTIDFSSKLSLPSRNTNPNLFNYRQYLLSKGIYTIATVKSYNILKVEKTNRYPYTLKRNVIHKVDNIYDKYLNKRNSSIMKSMLLGDSTYVGEDDLNHYRSLGLAHILAISGLHIGIISGFLLFIFSQLAIKRKISIFITLTFIWIYAFIVGFPPSILRANIMLSILSLSQIFHEPYDIINSVFLSMFILLIINPYCIFGLGFILSFMATLSIIILTPRIKDMFYPYENKIINSFSGILAVQIGLLPVLAYYFNSISLLSIIGNLLMIPILSLAIVLGFAMFFMEVIFPSVNGISGYFLNHILDFQFFLLDSLTKLDFKDIKMASPNLFTILLYYLFVLLLFKIIEIERLHKRVLKSISIYISIFILVNFIIIGLDERVEIHFIDVGQGDSILIRNSKFDYLIDTGGSLFGDFDIGKNITLPYLEKIGVKRLKTVFISHFHEDHYQGLFSMVGNLNIDYVVSGYAPLENPILESINREKIGFLLLNSGDRINMGQGLYMDIIWPGEKTSKNENNMSLVTVLNYKGHRILFTGDMEKEVERDILDYIGEDIDVIKVPHHGSNTSSTSDLLQRIKPSIGIITVGRKNMYNHPSNEVLDRYEELSTRIYRTDEMGRIKLVLREGEMGLETYLVDKINMEFYLLYYLIYFILSYIFIRIYDELVRRNNFEL